MQTRIEGSRLVSRLVNDCGSALFNGKIPNLFGRILSLLSVVILTSCNPMGETTIGNEFHPNIEISFAKSSLTVSSSTVASGSTVTATLILQDQNGLPYVSNLPVVVFASSGGTSTGTFSQTQSEDLTAIYTATFTGVNAGTPTTLYASVNGQKIASTRPTVQVVPGNISLLRSTVTVSASTVPVVNSVNVTLTVKDTLGNQHSSGGLTVAFSNTGGSSTGTFSAVTDHGNGTYSATFTGVSSGTATTITTSINAQSVLSTAPSLSVTGGIPTTIAVNSGNNQSVSAGSALASPLVVRLTDSNGDPASGITVNWAVASGGGALGGATSVTNGSGFAQNTYTLGATAGANSVTATVSGYPALTQSFSASGAAGAPTQITITAGQTQTAFLGAALGTALSVNVKDVNNNNVNTVTIDWSASSGTLGSGASTSTNASGNTSNALTLGTGATAAGAKTVTATINGTSTLVTFNVTASVAAPTTFAGTNSNGASSLSWTASPGATSYKIYRSTTSGSGYTSPGTSLSTTYADSGLVNGTPYYYVVTALNNGLESAYSSQITVLPVVAPGAPQSLAGTLASTQTVLTWTAPATGTGPFIYKVYRSTTSGSSYSLMNTTSAGVLTYTSTGLTNGTTYYYVVTANNGSVAGDSSNSSEIAITPDFVPTLAYDFTAGSSFQSHNLLTYSQDFSNAAWFKIGISIRSNSALAPDGTFTGNLLTESSGGSVHSIHQITTKTATAQSYTFSIYAKASGRTWARIDLWDGGSLGNRVWFNLSGSGIVGSTLNIGSGFTNVITSIQSVSSGWFRISLSATSSTSTRMDAYFYPSTADAVQSWSGDGTSGVYYWGAQLEKNPGVSKYVATTNSPGTSFSTPLSPTYGSTPLTFSRPDTVAAATVYGSDGKLRRAPHNLLTFSEQLDNAAWIKILSTVTPNATMAPDGNSTAELMVDDTTNGLHYIRELATINVDSTYSLTIFAKAANQSSVVLEFMNKSGTVYSAEFSLTSGSYLGTRSTIPLKYSSFSVGNGWYRLSITGSSSSGATATLINIISGTVTSRVGTGTGSIYVWGAQLEENLSPSSYLATTSSARFDGPRFDYDPVTLQPKGILIEGSRTNNHTNSEAFDNNTNWAKYRATVTANVAAAPDGTSTADKLVEDTTVNADHKVVGAEQPVVSGTVYTGSVYLKGGERTNAGVFLSNASLWPTATNPRVRVNLATGLITATANVSSSTITNVGNSWYRVSLTQTSVAGSLNTGLIVNLLNSSGTDIYTGDGSSGLFVWGAQIEQSSYPTNYIPTTSAAVTRNRDVVAFSDVNWFSNVAGSLEMEANTNRKRSDGSFANTYGGIFGLRNAGVTEAIRISFNGFTAGGDHRPWFSIISSGSTQFNLYPSTPSSSAYSKIGVGFSSNDFAATINNTTPVTTNSGSMVGAISSGFLGNDGANSTSLGGWIKSFKYFNTRLPDSEIQRRSQ